MSDKKLIELTIREIIGEFKQRGQHTDGIKSV